MCTKVIDGACVGREPISVLKFGSSLFSDAPGYRVAAGEVARAVDAGYRVLAVVSAMRGATDRLMRSATQLSNRPAYGLLSNLLKTGEEASVALLAIALTTAGLHAHGIGTEELALRTSGPLDDADPIGVDRDRLATLLAAHQVLVVPGFVGTDVGGSPSLLGRGGSDLTALFLAERLGAAEVRLVKDVDGVHPRDPRLSGRPSAPLATASWSEVGRIGNGLVQAKALRFAERHALTFRVAAPGGRGTLVGVGAP
jgi:homoserine dehydrogenase